MMDELLARRAGRREANLRELNQRIADAQHGVDDAVERLHLVCECARGECEDGLLVPSSVFDQLREATTRFLVAPGHVIHDVERQVDAGEGWVIVQKHGSAARAASEELR
jgi:hypothetical protein